MGVPESHLDLAHSAGLYGRKREMLAFHEALDQAALGQARCVLVVGEPGIGKSRLCRAFAEAASERGATVAWGRAWEAGGAPPFWPWIEALRSLFERGALDTVALGEERLAALARLVPEVAPASPPLSALDPDAARFLLFDAVGTCLKGMGQRDLVALVFDDLHAADSESLSLLHFVTRSVREAKLMVVGAYRDVEARLSASVGEALARIAREGRYLVLSRLSREDVKTWVEDASSSHRLFETLWSRAEGNPLYIVETLRLLRTQDERDPHAIPALAREVIRTRLRRLLPATQSLLEIAAVFGRRVQFELLVRVSGFDVVLARDCWAEALRAEVVALLEPGVAEFTHVLLRDALYEAVPAARRADLHAAVLGALAPEGPALTMGSLSEAVHHAFQAVPAFAVEEAVRWVRAAAARAVTDLSYDFAADWLERAVALLPPTPSLDPERCDLWLELAEAQVGAGRSASALDSGRNAAVLARKLGDARRLAEAALAYGRVYMLASVPAELVSLLEEALSALPEDETSLRARLLARLGSALQPARDPELPMAMARDAVLLAASLGDPRTELEVLFAAGSALGYFARPHERARVSLRLVEVADQLGDRARGLRARARLAMDFLEQGDISLAELYAGEYERMASALDVPSFAWVGRALGASLDLVRGRFTEAERKIEQASLLARRIDDVNAPLALAMQRIALLRAAGRSGELRDEAPRAIERVHRVADRWYAHSFAAAVNASAGRLDEARSSLATIALDLEVMRGRLSLTFVAEACVATKSSVLGARVFDLLGELEDRNHCWGMPALVCEGPLTHTLGRLAALLGRHDDPQRLFSQALERAKAMQAVAWLEQIERDRAELRTELDAHAPARPAFGAEVPRLPALTMALSGNVWTIVADVEIRLKDSRGLRILARLVGNPGREFHVTDLLAPPGEAGYVTDSGEVLDAAALSDYRRRLAALREREHEAREFNDLARAERISSEIEAIAQELSGAVGLGGRARRAGSTSEKARINVRQRLRDAIEKLGEQSPALGRHLRWAVRTGTFCSYDPTGR